MSELLGGCPSHCRWNAAGDNGSHITQYILEYDEGKGEDFVEVFKSRGKQHNLTKLQASTCYKFRLAAVNEYGKRYVACIIDTPEMNIVAVFGFTNPASGYSCYMSD
jgi:predicted secreted Zn-dependent protease